MQKMMGEIIIVFLNREVDNRDLDILLNFLSNKDKNIPRTMLRYSIEKFNEELRQKYFKGLI
jgi:hypothetical protein